MGTYSPTYISMSASTTPAAVTPTNAVGPVSTNNALCKVCSRYGAKEVVCTTIPNCVPSTAVATVYAGSSPVHVGTLTGTALFTSISSALDHLCPPVTQTTSITQCSETDTVTIKNIAYVDADDQLAQGELVVKVATSGYNVTSLRDAMIHSAALTAQNSAKGGNCYNKQYLAEQLRRRGPLAWIDGLLILPRWGSGGVKEREVPHLTSEHINLCNAAWFASVMYYSPSWRTPPHPGPTDFIDAAWEFHVAPGGDFACEFLQDPIDALVVVEPEFAVGDIELGQELMAICTEAMDAVNH